MALENSRRTQRRREAGPRKGDLREIEILHAAERLLGTMAYADMTMDDIAKRAGLSRSALYFYFRSKEAVLAALHERTHAVMGLPVQVLERTDASPQDAMHEAVAMTGRLWRAHGPALRTFHETAMSAPEFGQQWRTNLEQHVEFLTGLIERERAAGRAGPTPPSARAIASGVVLDARAPVLRTVPPAPQPGGGR